MASEGRFFRRILRGISGTGHKPEDISAARELFAANALEGMRDSGRKVEQMFMPLKQPHDALLAANKKRIFARIAELDSKGVHQLDLKKDLPEFGSFWSNEVAKANNASVYLNGGGLVWFAQQTNTSPDEAYQYENGVVTWVPGAPGLEQALMGIDG